MSFHEFNNSTNKEAAGVNGGVEQSKPTQFYQRGGAWQRASKVLPCPICGRFGWCSISADGALAMCMRVQDGAFRRTTHGGFLHRLQNNGNGRDRTSVRTVVIPFGTKNRPELTILARKFQTAVNPARLQRLADRLGVSMNSLQKLGIGWDTDRFAWSFPMATGRRAAGRNRRQAATSASRPDRC